MALSKISDLNFDDDFKIKAKVISKGTIFRPPRNCPAFANLELVISDETGSIFVQVVGPHLNEFFEYIKADRTYIFRDFDVKRSVSDAHYKRNPLKIQIVYASQMIECVDVPAPGFETIALLRLHRLFSPLERYFRNMRLTLINILSQTSTYIGCPDDACRRSIRGGRNGRFLCANGCGKTWDRVVTRFCLRLRFMDGSGTINVLAYDEVAVPFTGMTAQDFRIMARDAPRMLGRRINSAMNRVYNVRLQLKLEYFPQPLGERMSYILTNFSLA